MKIQRILMALFLMFAMAGLGALAQDGEEGSEDAAGQEMAMEGSIGVAESEEHGAYLTNAEGYALYAFVRNDMTMSETETMTEGVRENAAECIGGCLEAWPPLTTSEGTVPAAEGEGLQQQALYSATIGENNHVVYNGYPLYTFANDAQPGDTQGQGIQTDTGTWYLVAPDGTLITGADQTQDGG